jgi:hypothetical protein
LLKWFLAAVGFVAVMIALFVGVLLFLFNREEPDMSTYTELHRAEVLELTDLGSSYRVVYEYTYDGQTFYGRTTIYSDSMSRGSTFGICIDPSDPAQHAQTQTDCFPGEPRTPKEGLKEKPDL